MFFLCCCIRVRSRRREAKKGCLVILLCIRERRREDYPIALQLERVRTALPSREGMRDQRPNDEGRVLTPIKEHGNERNGTRLFVVVHSVPT